MAFKDQFAIHKSRSPTKFRLFRVPVMYVIAVKPISRLLKQLAEAKLSSTCTTSIQEAVSNRLSSFISWSIRLARPTRQTRNQFEFLLRYELVSGGM